MNSFIKAILLSLLGLSLPSFSVEAQLSTVDEAENFYRIIQKSKPDTNQVQALLELSSFYLHKTYSPRMELDSALILVKQAEALSHQLNYAKGLEEAVFLKGTIFIRQDNSDILPGMLSALSDTNHIKLLVELGKYHLRPTNTKNADWDSAMVFFHRAEILSDSVEHQKWKEESQCLMGATYLLKGDWMRGKAYFLQVIEARQNAGDKHGEMKAWLRMATVRFCDDCS
jgi:hypothetical protein